MSFDWTLHLGAQCGRTLHERISHRTAIALLLHREDRIATPLRLSELLSDLGVLLQLLDRVVHVAHAGTFHTGSASVHQIGLQAIVELAILQLGSLLLNAPHRIVRVRCRSAQTIKRLLNGPHLAGHHPKVACELPRGNRTPHGLFRKILDAKASSEEPNEREQLRAQRSEGIGGALIPLLDLLGGREFFGGELLRGRAGLGLAALERARVEPEGHDERIYNLLPTLLSPLIHCDALVMAVDDDQFEQIVQILLPVDGAQFVQRREPAGNDHADRARHVGIRDQASAAAAAPEACFDGAAARKPSRCRSSTAFRSFRRVATSSMSVSISARVPP